MLKSEKRTMVCNLVSALLMVALLVCQFLPYWHYGEGNATASSIYGYVWFPHQQEGLSDYLLSQDAGHYINDVAWPVVGMLVICVAGVLLCLWKRRSALSGIWPMAGGIVGLWFYLSVPVMRIGSGWWMHLALLVAMLVVGVVGLVGLLGGRRERA